MIPASRPSRFVWKPGFPYPLLPWPPCPGTLPITGPIKIASSTDSMHADEETVNRDAHQGIADGNRATSPEKCG